jgi:hypothetical protein
MEEELHKTPLRVYQSTHFTGDWRLNPSAATQALSQLTTQWIMLP